jgi:hypothetical protein
MTIRDNERRAAERILGPVIMPPEKPTFSPWVFPESGDFMVCTDGQSGGTVPFFDKLFPSFDYPHEDGSTHWCIRHELLGGDTVPIAEIHDGAAQDLLIGLNVDGHELSQSEADSMDFELRQYLAALFAMAPKMHAFLRDRVAREGGAVLAEGAEELLAELAHLAK